MIEVKVRGLVHTFAEHASLVDHDGGGWQWRFVVLGGFVVCKRCGRSMEVVEVS